MLNNTNPQYEAAKCISLADAMPVRRGRNENAYPDIVMPLCQIHSIDTSNSILTTVCKNRIKVYLPVKNPLYHLIFKILWLTKRISIAAPSHSCHICPVIWNVINTGSRTIIIISTILFNSIFIYSHSLFIFTDNSARVSHRNYIVGNILCYHASCTDYCVISYGNTRKNNRSSANPHIITNFDGLRKRC